MKLSYQPMFDPIHFDEMVLHEMCGLLPDMVHMGMYDEVREMNDDIKAISERNLRRLRVWTEREHGVFL